MEYYSNYIIYEIHTVHIYIFILLSAIYITAQTYSLNYIQQSHNILYNRKGWFSLGFFTLYNLLLFPLEV